MKMIATLFFVFVFAFASPAFGFTCPVPETTPGADIGKIAGQWNRILGPTLTLNNTLTFIPREDLDFEIKVPGNIITTGEKFVAYWYGRRTDNQNLLNIYYDVSKVIVGFNEFLLDDFSQTFNLNFNSI
uniref:Lipocalin/cytosolic fatty-acid binding domain-containing protein n=1 Tax=Tetranychus urticae TaxID=32264 RepID=T1KUE7_TETUR